MAGQGVRSAASPSCIGYVGIPPANNSHEHVRTAQTGCCTDPLLGVKGNKQVALLSPYGWYQLGPPLLLSCSRTFLK